MSDIDDSEVKDLDCTERWRAFYKDRAQKLKNQNSGLKDDKRTERLEEIAESAVSIRKEQLQAGWYRLLNEITASAASAKLMLPENRVTDAAVMLFTCRAMRRLGLDDCPTKKRIYQQACLEGGVEDITLPGISWDFSKHLVTELQRAARLRKVREWLEWCLTNMFKMEEERSSRTSNEMVEAYKTLETFNNMGKTLDTTRANHQKVLNHLEEEARNYHISDLVPPAIEQTR